MSRDQVNKTIDQFHLSKNIFNVTFNLMSCQIINNRDL